MKRYIFIALCSALLSACQNDGKKANWSKARIEMEDSAQICLRDARAALERSDYATARSKVREIRNKYNLALDAREEAILFMDSVDLCQATEELQRANKEMQLHPEPHDSLKAVADELNQKIKFYLRKLEHDRQNKRTH